MLPKGNTLAVEVISLPNDILVALSPLPNLILPPLQRFFFGPWRKTEEALIVPADNSSKDVEEGSMQSAHFPTSPLSILEGKKEAATHAKLHSAWEERITRDKMLVSLWRYTV